MTNEPERIRSDAAAKLVGVSTKAFGRLADRRGWQAERDDEDGRFVTYDRVKIEQEARRRHASALRITPADLRHTVRCAAIIRTYWARRGHTVDVEAVGTEIISDLLNGLPVRR